MGYRRIRSAALAIVLGAGAVTAATALPEVANAEPGTLAVPAPVVEGPIPSSGATSGMPRDYPFMATPIDLAARGYVEEEYFISLAPTSGVPGSGACTYTTPAGATGSVINCNGSYKTRIMVRRPASADAFNGTVLLEWQNVTAQYDVDHYWLESSEHIMREGYAWVGVSAQRAGVVPAAPICNPGVPATWVVCNSLRAWSPLRYGDAGGNLNIPLTNPGDALSYDIFSHAAQALRDPHPDGPAPMADLETRTVIALGTSQSGGRLATYYNSVQPLQADPVIDAFFIGEARAAVRADREVPVLRLLSEVDVAGTFSPPDTDWYRHWEIAGASHADEGFTSKIQEFVEAGVILQTEPVCARNAPSRIPKRYTYHAAWDHMVRWVNGGTAPPIAPRIEYVDGVIARRPSFTPEIPISGNAIGGIQLSEHSVPTAYNGTGNGGGTFCNLFGVHEPFSPQVLRSLYRNHGAYVSAVAKANNDNRRAGFIVAADSDESTRLAAESGVGRR
jgi:hypothetical protein